MTNRNRRHHDGLPPARLAQPERWEQLSLLNDIRSSTSERRAWEPSPMALVADLPITEVLRRIPLLTRHEMAQLRRHEREGRGRPIVLSAIEERMKRS